MKNTGKNTQKHAVIVTIMLGAIMAILASFSAPVHAQTAPTSTPIPPIAITATAAAQRVQSAQAQQAQADQLQAQAVSAQQAAQAAYQQAQAEASAAREALAAQQYQSAGEALGRADLAIETGRQQIDALGASYGALRGIVASQVETITTQADELAQCRVTAQNYSAAYNATDKKLQEAQSSAVNPVVPFALALAFVFLMGIVFIVVLEKWRKPKLIRPDQEIIDQDDPAE